MTDRLSQLMTTEADALAVPPAPAGAVLDEGRRMKQRRRVAQVAVGLTVLAVIGVGATVLSPTGQRGAALDPATAPEQGTTGTAGTMGPAFSVGTTLYLDAGRRTATVDDDAVKSMYYTSAGVLVRHGENPFSDGGGPQRFSLVTSDGDVRPLALETEETVHATDPAQPYVVYVAGESGSRSVVVVDVRNDQEVARVDLAESRADFAPVALSGDRVYVGDGRRTLVVEWRTGEVSVSDVVIGFPVVAGGLTPGTFGRTPSVIDVATGETVLRVEAPPGAQGTFYLSLDGRYALLWLEDLDGRDRENDVEVFDVATGTSVTVPGTFSYQSWSDDGRLFYVEDDGSLLQCAAATGECRTDPVDVAVGPQPQAGDDDFSDDVVLAGQVRES